jgi:DNA mismatch repair protein MutS
MIIDDYIEYTIKYKEKYGDKTIVLMQVGSFFELYSIDIEDNDIYKIADICNIQISRKNKTIQEVSRNNPLMCGFPLYVLNKFSGLLLQNNYTIILIEQVTEPPNPYREVTEILSPGMNLIPVNKKSNYMIVIYCEIINEYLIVGISGVDLSTGHSFVYEAGSTKQDPSFATDEAYRIVAAYNPCEIVFVSNEKLPDTTKDCILKILNTNNILIHKKWENYEYIKEVSKISYQNSILEKSYANKKSLLSIIELLNLEKYNIARISFCCLIQFAYEHNSDIIKELNPPEILENDKILTIEYNSALQLNLISLNTTEKPLLDILNRCSTPFGTRAFKERLLNPIINTTELNKRYDEIEYLLENDKFKKISKILNNILDLERIKRRMIVNKFPPMDWCSFNISLEYAIEALELLGNDKSFEIINKINTVKSSYKDIINLDLAGKYNLSDIKGTVFYEGIYKEIDRLDIEYNENYKKISDICNKITELDKEGDSTSCKIDYNERDGYYISITKKRYDTALLKDREYINKFDKKSLSASSNILKLTNKIITSASNNIERIQIAISSMVLDEYKKFVANFINDNNDTIENIIVYLTSLDISCCNAKNAYEFRYYRPDIINKSASYIECKNIRHPIIERIDDRVPYVGNDIVIGTGSGEDSFNGMLLYGINASGKSSFMKTLGLNIIMAQAGMYVAASYFKYQPYHHIFTRISGMDNIYKGMSSFTVEMTELRNILQRCTKYSLVLGDELCCGTESTSALSIVAAGIDTLIKKNVSFIFATHLHELVSLEIIKKYINKELYIGHMHITIEPTTNRIIYERKIKDGKGSSIYGLEVCKSLDMPYDFMRIAEDIRKEVQGLNQHIINTNKSRYNSELYMMECGVCGNPAIDTHHINYQSEANEEGYFNDFHKNAKHNLVPLCKECHIKEHTNQINIKGYTKTSEGIVLNVETTPNISETIEPIEPQKLNKTPEILETNQNINDIDLIDYDNLKKYIRRGKENWYMRTKITSAFRKNTNEKKIIDIINKLEDCNISIINDKMYNKLFDPSL